MKIRNCIPVLSLLFCMVAGQNAPALTYQARNLGTLDGVVSSAWGVNQSGNIVGSYSDTAGYTHPVLWSPDGSSTTLSHTTYGEAHDINNLGQIVGSSSNHAAIWNPDGTRLDIGPPPDALSCAAWGISDTGWVAGQVRAVNAHDGAAICKPDHSAVNIVWGSPGFADTYSAFRINDSGVAVGVSTHGYAPLAAEIYTFTDHSHIAGGLFQPSAMAWGINDQGYIAGMYDNRATVWAPDGSYVQYDNDSFAYAINDSGLVAGKNGSKAALWQSGILTELEMLPGMQSAVAYDISDNGWIVGESIDLYGHTYATLWQPSAAPVAEPSTIVYALLSGIGAAGALMRRRQNHENSKQ